MAILEHDYNIYADLAQGAYTGRPTQFPYDKNKWNDGQLDSHKKNESVKFNFAGAKDAHGNSINTVYLQPDNTVKTVTEKKFFGKDKEYQKGLLTDEKAGYNSYYLTDTPTLNAETKHTYFTTRGSDGISWDNKNDWLGNNYEFAVNNAYIPQAKLATEAMHQKIKEMGMKAPNATISMTGHSLGTMVTIQAVANLPAGDIDKIDKVILFQGPDARASINEMSKQAQQNIQRLEEQGKIEYYVNAFDIVSMLNRNKKGVDEIGKVHYLLPKSFTSTFDGGDPGSSHDFGQYQLNPDGTPKEANLKEHGYIFAAGIKISNLIDKYLNILTKDGQKSGLSFTEAIKLLVSGDYKDFEKEYSKIIADAEAASKWNEKVSGLQKSIRGASGSKKIKLRGELATEVAKKAKTVGDEYVLIQKNDQQEAEDEVDLVVQEIRDGALAIQQSLESYEVEALIAPYKKNNLWDSGQATSNTNEAKKYKEKLTAFSKTLTTVAKNIQEYDGNAGKNIFMEK
ncbi:cutinase family protein [Enterococcus sp. UD-01]|uniref:cutinase family protein n=1 Tax=Enterococcus sp. UD-01 TaxID=3373911 RepID=UPI0038386373